MRSERLHGVKRDNAYCLFGPARLTTHTLPCLPVRDVLQNSAGLRECTRLYRGLHLALDRSLIPCRVALEAHGAWGVTRGN